MGLRTSRCALLFSKRYGWLEARRAPGRQVAGEHAYRTEDRDCGRERGRIARLQTEQQRRGRARGGSGQDEADERLLPYSRLKQTNLMFVISSTA